MACEISPICDFLFLNQDKFTNGHRRHRHVQKGPHHRVMIFTLWSKNVAPFPSLRCKIQAYQDDQRCERVLPWNRGNTFQFYAPPITQNNPRKRAPGKIRARWSNKSRYNPMKTKRSNTPEMTVTNMDTMDMDKKVPLSVKVCKRFGSSCSFCKKNVSHPSPQESDWSDEGWTGGHINTQKQTGDTNQLSDSDLSKPQSNPDSELEVDKLNMNKLLLNMTIHKRNRSRLPTH